MESEATTEILKIEGLQEVAEGVRIMVTELVPL